MQNIEILFFAIFYNQEIFVFDIYILLFDDFHFWHDTEKNNFDIWHL